MSTRTPQSIAAHITTALIPAITTTAGQLGRHPGNLITRLQGAAINLANVDMPAIAASLGREHHTAAAGRPRQGAGGNTGGIGTSTTEDIGCELDRISRYWLDLTETIDRLHPHPDWPPITSGLRARLTTATEALIAACVPRSDARPTSGMGRPHRRCGGRTGRHRRSHPRRTTRQPGPRLGTRTRPRRHRPTRHPHRSRTLHHHRL